MPTACLITENFINIILYFYLQCLYYDVPCCHDQTLLEPHQDAADEYICWEFGTGQCTPKKSIPNLEKYLELIKDANSANFIERYHQYWNELGEKKSASWLESKVQALQDYESKAKKEDRNRFNDFYEILYNFLYLYVISKCLDFMLTIYHYSRINRQSIIQTLTTYYEQSRRQRRAYLELHRGMRELHRLQ